MGDVFRALADPTRRAILDELAERDGQTLFELCARLAMKHQLGSTRQAVSQHLDVLEDAGLVRTWRRGRYKLHALQTAPLERILERWLSRSPPPSARPMQQVGDRDTHLPSQRLDPPATPDARAASDQPATPETASTPEAP